MKYKDGEYQLFLNEIGHWIKIEGSSNKTVPLVILHGGPGGNHYVFERTAGPMLAKERTVIYYEQRGCGRSDTPHSEDYSVELLVNDFSFLVEQLGIKRVDVLGYSFGGELALEVALAFPGIINKIVLSAPSLMFSDMVYDIQIQGFKKISDEEFSDRIEKLLSQNLTFKEIWQKVWALADSELVDRFLFEDVKLAKYNRRLWENSGLSNTGKMMKALQGNPPSTPLEKRLNRIMHPTLILTGAHDRNTGLKISNIMKQELPNSKLEIFKKSAHFPDIEEESKFVAKTLQFLR
ncbi:alpha/beta hydrolase [Fictibacillus sp. 5RED26]|uniref:alpha/beta fold hydrolase n=1 Tax=Fictibacillus sp. 5RED26 TaxID=2745876 RepID=UPI0018CF715C|nr:alpha/beta hydrolase [Fictibacillus sp. 5RED26]MBH0155222.1 alpha/beta hydrolase [Fictibacillus sp. 5RED26]